VRAFDALRERDRLSLVEHKGRFRRTDTDYRLQPADEWEN